MKTTKEISDEINKILSENNMVINIKQVMEITEKPTEKPAKVKK